MTMLSAHGCMFVPATSDDGPFLKRLFLETQRQAHGQLPLPPQAIDDMLAQMFMAQTDSFQHSFPEATNIVLKTSSGPIGRLLADFTEEPVHVVDLAVLPPFQNKGFGTRVLRAVQDHAAKSGMSLRLLTLEAQPAQRLYARLGFEVVTTQPPHVTMVWSPA